MKRRKCRDVAERVNAKHADYTKAAAASSEIAKRHLIVALIDRSNPLGQMSQQR